MSAFIPSAPLREVPVIPGCVHGPTLARGNVLLSTADAPSCTSLRTVHEKVHVEARLDVLKRPPGRSLHFRPAQ
jgi:hypothetical protein